VWWGRPSFPSFRRTCKVGYHTHARQFSLYVIRHFVNHSASSGSTHLQGSLSKPFFFKHAPSLSNPSPSLDPTSSHRNEKSWGGEQPKTTNQEMGEKELRAREEKEPPALRKGSSTQLEPHLLSFSPLQETQRRCKVHPETTARRDLATTSTNPLSTLEITPAPPPVAPTSCGAMSCCRHHLSGTIPAYSASLPLRQRRRSPSLLSGRRLHIRTPLLLYLRSWYLSCLLSPSGYRHALKIFLFSILC